MDEIGRRGVIVKQGSSLRSKYLTKDQAGSKVKREIISLTGFSIEFEN